MFAVIKTGGKQYKVAKDLVLKLEKVEGNAGDKINFNEVLVCGDKVGAPLIDGASVTGEILEQKKDKKVIVFKKKRRHNYRRKKGHRQEVSIIKITDIKVS